jgi:hypothetical protein
MDRRGSLRGRRGTRTCPVMPLRGIVTRVEVEDPVADVVHGLVQLTDQFDQLVAQADVADAAGQCLHAHAGGVQPLDDVVVEVPADAVTFLEQVQPVQDLLTDFRVQGQRDLGREGADHLAECSVEGRPSGVPGSEHESVSTVVAW